MMLIHLLLVLAVQAGILLAVGQPFLTFGVIAVAVGAVGGLVRNQIASGVVAIGTAKAVETIKNLVGPRKRSKGLPDNGLRPLPVPIVVLVPGQKLAKIDSFSCNEDIDAGRRRWIMTAIDEKLAAS